MSFTGLMMIIFKLHGNDASEHLSLSQHNKDFNPEAQKIGSRIENQNIFKIEGVRRRGNAPENGDSLLSFPEKRGMSATSIAHCKVSFNFPPK